MCIPPEETDPERQRMWFARLRELQEALNARGAVDRHPEILPGLYM